MISVGDLDLNFILDIVYELKFWLGFYDGVMEYCFWVGVRMIVDRNDICERWSFESILLVI